MDWNGPSKFTIEAGLDKNRNTLGKKVRKRLEILGPNPPAMMWREYESIIKYHMDQIAVSNDSVSLCQKDRCIKATGNIARELLYGFSIVVLVSVIGSIAQRSR